MFLSPGLQSAAYASKFSAKTAGKITSFSPVLAPGISPFSPTAGLLDLTMTPSNLPTLTSAIDATTILLPTAEARMSPAALPVREKAPTRVALAKTARQFADAKKQGGGKSATVARRTFDAGGKNNAETASVDLSELSSVGISRPMLAPPAQAGNHASPLHAVYEVARWAGRSKMPSGAPEIEGGLRERFNEVTEAGVLGLAASLFAGLSIPISNLLNMPIAMPLLLAAGGLFAYHAMRESVGTSRDITLYTIQYSHDTVYRTKGTELVDVRGTNKSYGNDRYRQAIPGPIGRTAHLFMRLLASTAPGLWLFGSGADLGTFGVYSLATLATFALSDIAVNRSDRAWRDFSDPGSDPPTLR